MGVLVVNSQRAHIHDMNRKHLLHFCLESFVFDEGIGDGNTLFPPSDMINETRYCECKHLHSAIHVQRVGNCSNAEHLE